MCHPNFGIAHLNLDECVLLEDTLLDYKPIAQGAHQVIVIGIGGWLPVITGLSHGVITNSCCTTHGTLVILPLNPFLLPGKLSPSVSAAI